jgi:hypothetical protein
MMTESEQPTPHQFAATFRDVIRVGFNWDRFFEENWPIELVHLTTHSDLQRCFMPWYIGVMGEEVAYDHPNAVPMNLSDVPKAFKLLNDERRADIENYVAKLSTQEEKVGFVAPTYALPQGRHFILDRNHRLSALMLQSVPFEVTLWNVRGPLEPECLLDLIHWTPPRKSSSC